MLPATPLLTTEDRQRQAQLLWHAREIVEGMTAGIHRSPHKGSSIEFKEHREYVRGDEIRSIDWKLYGKTDRLYIRQYEEETSLRATLVVDQSGSMQYRGETAGQLSKLEFAQRLAASLAYLFLSQQDAVGLATVDTEVRSYVPPRSRPGHLTALLAPLLTVQAGGETALSHVLGLLAPKIRRRGVVVLLSDCFEAVDPLLTALAQLRHARNDLVILQVLHRDEVTFPFRGKVEFRSLEQAAQRQTTDPWQIRAGYLRRFEQFRAALSDGCQRQRISLVPCTTDQSPADVLQRLLEQRERGG